MDYKEEMLDILERIYGRGEDVALPIPDDCDGVAGIVLLASMEGYAVQGPYEPVHFESVEDLYADLISAHEAIARGCNKDIGRAMYDLYADLNHFDPGIEL